MVHLGVSYKNWLLYNKSMGISIASRSESSDCFILYIYLYLNKKLKKACFKCTSANAPCFRGENCWAFGASHLGAL